MFFGLLTATLPGALMAAAEPSARPGAEPAAEPSAASGPGARTSAGRSANPFGDRSDAELTALAADWDALDRHQRRALLTEMKLRMARRGEGKGTLHIRTERRYGRLIRQSDGRVIRIETQVVHVRPLDPDAQPGANGQAGAPRQGFGVGFETRVARRAASVPATAPLSVSGGGSPDGSAGGDAPTPTFDDLQQSLEVDPLPVPPLPIYQAADPAP